MPSDTAHLLFVPSPQGYRLAEVDGPAPEPGAEVERDARRFTVTRVGPSPLPADERACAYLLPVR